MTDTPTADHPAFVAEEPEHCPDCCRVIRGGERYFVKVEQAVVCPDWVRKEDAIRLPGGLTVEIGENRLLLRRGRTEIEALPHEVRHIIAVSLVSRMPLYPCR